MPKITIRPGKNNRAVYRHIKRMPAKVRRGIQNAMLEMKKELKKTAIEDMKKPKHGRLYFVYVGKGGKRLKRGRWHRASRKGESPAILTGALSKSINSRIKYGSLLTFGANTPYARKHELGGRRYLLRAISQRRGEIKNWFRRELEKELCSLA